MNCNTLTVSFQRGHIKSHTADNGTRIPCHEMIIKNLKVTIYFVTHTLHGQKGAIENANGLISQYVPKKGTFEHISQQQITKYSKEN